MKVYYFSISYFYFKSFLLSNIKSNQIHIHLQILSHQLFNHSSILIDIKDN